VIKFENGEEAELPMFPELVFLPRVAVSPYSNQPTEFTLFAINPTPLHCTDV
jgi:hypothetical protein